MLTEIAKQQLMKAGWYEGRKIDVSHYEKKFIDQGFDFFPVAGRFLEEFGDLDIKDKYYLKSLPNISSTNPSSTKLDVLELWTLFECDEFIKKIGQKIVPVAIIEFMSIEIFISEDGKFYEKDNHCSPGGLRAENSDQLWNEYYGAEEAGWASWEDLKAGKGRTMRKNINSGRIYL